MRHLAAAGLFSLVTTAFAADNELPFDSRPLVRIDSLQSVPQEVLRQIAGPAGSRDAIADRWEKFNSKAAEDSDLPRRLLLEAAASGAAVVILYEQAGRPPTFHALAYMMTNLGWRKVGNWDLDPESTHLWQFLYEFDTARYGEAAQRYLEDKRKRRTELRISLTLPARPTGPLRYVNLSDIEAREIKAVMQQFFPGAILNISGVVTGCPCEEGPHCSDQVWVVPEDDVRTPGVLLSRVSERWTIGAVQRWWIDRADLQVTSRLNTRQRQDALDTQWKSFPACVESLNSIPAPSTVKETKGSPPTGPILHTFPVTIPEPIKVPK